MGGRRDGSRMGRARRGGVRAPARLPGLAVFVRCRVRPGRVTMNRSLSSQPANADQRPSAPVPAIGVGMLGYGFMGRAHSSAFRTIRHMTWPPPLVPELVSIAGRSEAAVAGAAEEFGFA